ncbi:MAG: SpoVA/SpoVAEb family sporulation membrane protein, partial [Clostridia bacterium]|nr:SpoVA/SpoVAEb family sporulation membrane protein [Clostridia bacterium]
AQGAIEAVKESGFLGAFQGGLTAAAGGIVVAIFSAFIVALIFNSRTKHLK